MDIWMGRMYLEADGYIAWDLSTRFYLNANHWSHYLGYPVDWTQATLRKDTQYWYTKFSEEPTRLTAIPSDKDENGEVIKELDTKLHAWYSNKNEGFIGVIVKSDAYKEISVKLELSTFHEQK